MLPIPSIEINFGQTVCAIEAISSSVHCAPEFVVGTEKEKNGSFSLGELYRLVANHTRSPSANWLRRDKWKWHFKVFFFEQKVCGRCRCRSNHMIKYFKCVSRVCNMWGILISEARFGGWQTYRKYVHDNQQRTVNVCEIDKIQWAATLSMRIRGLRRNWFLSF